MQIRPLLPGDALEAPSKLFDAYRQFYGYASDLGAARIYLHMRLQSDQAKVFIAELAGKPVGFMLLYPSFCSLALAPIWVLNDLYVAPEARGTGVADALLQTARQLGLDSGAAYLMLSTAHDNQRAQAVYTRQGWQLDQVYRYYTLPLHSE